MIVAEKKAKTTAHFSYNRDKPPHRIIDSEGNPSANIISRTHGLQICVLLHKNGRLTADEAELISAQIKFAWQNHS